MSKDALISIVDDDESLREATKNFLKASGISAETFSSAEEFLQSSRLPRTACLIADVHMPGMSGRDLHHQLVTSGKPIPTILITAYPDETVRARALQAGVAYYLTKPVNGDDLLACIQSILGPPAADEKEPFGR